MADVVRRGEKAPITEEQRRTVAALFNGDLENPAPAKEGTGLLSVAETVGSAFITVDFETREARDQYAAIFSKANPEAKPILYKILAQTPPPRPHETQDTVIMILGYIGDGKDAAKLEQYLLHDVTGELTPQQTGPVTTILDSLARMSRRGVQEASEILGRMCDVSYWQQVRFRWPGEGRTRTHSTAQELTTRSLETYAQSNLSNRADRRARAEAFANTLQDATIKRALGGRVTAKRLDEVAQAAQEEDRRPIVAIKPEMKALLLKRFNGDLENPAPAKEETRGAVASLSVPETMGAVFHLQSEGRPWHLYARANPDARPAVHLVLGNPRLAEYHPAAWHILGYIGDNTSVHLLEQNLLSLRGIQSGRKGHPVEAMFNSLGLMARRNVQGATVLAEQMATPGFWEKAEFRWVADGAVPNGLSFAQESIARLAESYAISEQTNIQQRVSAFISAMPAGRQKDEMLGRTDASNVKRIADVIRRGERQPVRPEERSAVSRLFNGDLENPGPAREESREPARSRVVKPVFTSDVPVSAADALQKEGIAQYEAIKAAFEKGEYESVLDRLMSDGVPKSVSMMKSKREEMTAAFDMERKLLQHPAVRGARPVEFSLSQSSLAADGTPIESLDRRDILLTFKLSGTKGVFEEVSKISYTASSTFAPDGCLLVVMKRIDGKWYWNPFGF